MVEAWIKASVAPLQLIAFCPKMGWAVTCAVSIVGETITAKTVLVRPFAAVMVTV